MTRHTTPENNPSEQPALFDVSYGSEPAGLGRRPQAEFILPEDAISAPSLADTQPVAVEAPVVDIRERAAHLSAALGHLAQVSKRVGWEKGLHTEARDQIEKSTQWSMPGVAHGVRFTKEQEMKRAKEAFRSAYNLGEDVPVNVEDVDFKDAFSVFTQKYGVGANPEDTQRRRGRRDQLRKNLKQIRQIPGDLEKQTYEPVAEDEPATLPPAVQKQAEPVAKTYDKLIGLKDDGWAGFLPKTHTEKNQAYEILDYMNLQKYPTGVNKRLDEIARHQQKLAQEKGLRGRDIYEYGREAVVSVLNEWGDHLQNAIRSHEQLSQLQQQLDSGISPRISTHEATEPEDGQTFDYNALVRFVHLKALREGKPFAFDPLRTREDRSVIDEEKNKVIEDDYTAVGSLSEIQHFIDEAAQTLDVKDSRVLVREALEDEASRRLFWYRALSAANEEGFKEIAERVLERSMAPVPA